MPKAAAAAAMARVVRLALCVAIAACLGAVPAQAAFPGQNGKIAFDRQNEGGSTREIFVMNPDGTGQVGLTGVVNFQLTPAWSPDGQKIAYARESDDNSDDDIYVMNANGSGQANVTPDSTGDFDPAWSPDGQQIVFAGFRSGIPEILVMSANGLGQTPLTSNAASDVDPAWSPDGQKIAFTSDGEIHVMNANGTGQLNLTNDPAPDSQPAWSPDGQKIAFTRSGEIHVMSATGSAPTPLTSNGGTNDQPAWSPDGQKIAFQSTRDGNAEIYVMDADGTDEVNRTNNALNDRNPDWQPAPPVTQPGCGNTSLQLNRATVEGTLAETGPGTGQFRAGPGQQVYVGGFDLRPRLGGGLLVDTNANTLTAEGTGVQVFFGRFEVPLDVSSIPVNTPEATFPMNRDGTLLKSLFSLPISGQLKAAWVDGGKSAGLELELDAEKLVGDFGSFQGAGVTAPSLKATAKQANCTGFDFTGAELKADEISFIPKKLRVPKKLGLRNVLFKFQDDGTSSTWTGQGELILPTGKGELSVGGNVSIADSKLAGLGIAASGINKHIGYGLFLQRVEGEMAFEPDIGGNFGANATLGPQIQGKKLVKLGGNLKFLALATECTNGRDPISLVATGNIPLVEELGAGSVKIEGVNCIYTDSLGIEQSPKVEAVFGEVVNGEVPNPVVAAKANLSGFVGEDGFNAEGGGSITIPVVGEVSGQALMSSNAFAACGRVGFFSGGAAHAWGQSRTDAFTGCDLAPWRAGATSSAFAGGALGIFEPKAQFSITADVPGKLPFVGWSAQGTDGPPRLRVTGPRGERYTSLPGRALVRRNVVMVPVAAERRTFVFVKSPRVGRWRIDGVGERISGVRTARGLPKPDVRGELVPEGATQQKLVYTVAPLSGQRVHFYERTEDGVLSEIGAARGRAGQILFTPVSGGQPARIDAVVEQNGFPRDTITVARFTATPPGAKPPAPPRKLRAKRAGRALTVSWAHALGAVRYRVDVTSGRRPVAGRTTKRAKVKFERVPAGPLRVEVRAISGQGAASRPTRATVRRAKR